MEARRQQARSEWGRERRSAKRFSLAVPVKLLYGKAPVEAQFGLTYDMSSGGTLLMLPRELAPGTEVQLRVSMPRDLQNIRSQFVEVLARGVVARVIRRDNRIGVGVRILSVTPIGHA